MKRFKNLIIIGLIIILPIIIFILDINLECVFKKIFGIACPGCGLTHSIKELFHFNIIGSLKYNFLTIPLIIGAVYSVISLTKDFIKNEDTYIISLLNFFKKYYIVIIILLVIQTIINNI